MDATARDLERAAAASPEDVEARARHLQARIRAGTLHPKALDLAAYAGDRAALSLIAWLRHPGVCGQLPPSTRMTREPRWEGEGLLIACALDHPTEEEREAIRKLRASCSCGDGDCWACHGVPDGHHHAYCHWEGGSGCHWPASLDHFVYGLSSYDEWAGVRMQTFAAIAAARAVTERWLEKPSTHQRRVIETAVDRAQAWLEQPGEWRLNDWLVARAQAGHLPWLPYPPGASEVPEGLYHPNLADGQTVVRAAREVGKAKVEAAVRTALLERALR